MYLYMNYARIFLTYNRTRTAKCQFPTYLSRTNGVSPHRNQILAVNDIVVAPAVVINPVFTLAETLNHSAPIVPPVLGKLGQHSLARLQLRQLASQARHQVLVAHLNDLLDRLGGRGAAGSRDG